jgi:putative transposase
MVEDGENWECLGYIELNSVRCGVVAHPREWERVGYHEIMGQRRRYRVIDLDRLRWRC